MNAAVTPDISTSQAPIQAADRLGFTLFLAAAIHALLILGISFDLPDPNTLSKTLEVTLATLKSDKKPEEADYLAQINQEGSGTLEHKATPKTTEEAPFQDKEIRKVAPPTPAPQMSIEPTPAKALTTRAPSTERVTPQPVKPEPKPIQRPTPSFDASMLSAEIASLEAQLSQERELYAKRPRVHRLNAASTMQDKGAWYKEDWRKKVERIGNLNYPAQARQQQIYGSLRMLVSINRDGTLREVSVLESSGKPVLDQAALRIVRLAAPFAPFTGDLADVDVLEIIRTWRFESGDRLSSR